MTVRLMCGFEAGDSLMATTLTGTYSLGQSIFHPKPTGSWAGEGSLRTNPSAATGNWILRGWGATGAAAELGDDSLYASVALYIATMPDQNCIVLQIMNSANGVMMSARLNATGLVVCNYSDATDTTVLVGNSTQALNTGQWYTIEIAATSVSAVGGGTATLGIDQQTITSASGLTFRSGSRTCDRVRVGVVTAGTTTDLYFDDLVADNAAFPSNTYIAPLYPTGNVTTAWATGTGTGFGEVDEVTGAAGNDGDTSYLGSSTSGNVATYTGTSILPVTMRQIVAVQPYIVIRDEGGASTLNLRHISGATTTNLSTLDPGATYVMNSTILNTDPNTSAAWTVAAVNAFTIGVVNGAAVAARCTAVGQMVAFRPWNRTALLGAG